MIKKRFSTDPAHFDSPSQIRLGGLTPSSELILSRRGPLRLFYKLNSSPGFKTCDWLVVSSLTLQAHDSASCSIRSKVL